MVFDYFGRCRRLRSAFAGLSLDSLLISKKENIYYLSGFTGDDSLLLITGDQSFLITDFRYREQAEKELFPGCELRLRSSSPLATAAADLIREARLQRVGFEAEYLSWAAHRRLKERFSGGRLLPAGQLVGDLRVIKEPGEIARLREACARTVRVFNRFRDSLVPGRTEAFLAGVLSAAFYQAGGEPAFDPITAVGENSSQPHAAVSDRRFQPGEIFLVDLGGRWDFYNSDLTRTLVGGTFPRRFKTVYRAVLSAQKQAIRSIHPGVSAAEVDRVARGSLEGKGWGEYFGHSLGHGVGLEVHERPAISPGSREVLKEGMVLTVEPGVYLPGWGGIRIEDTVLVTADGCEILTTTPKTLESCLLKW